MVNEAELNALSHKIIGACIEVHRALGPGLLEKVYQDCLCHELDLRGIKYIKEPILKYSYKELPLDLELRADLIVEDSIVVELKAVKEIHPVYEAQLLSYLRLSNKPVGLLINFNIHVLKNGIVRRTLEGLPKIQEDDYAPFFKPTSLSLCPSVLSIF